MMSKPYTVNERAYTSAEYEVIFHQKRGNPSILSFYIPRIPIEVTETEVRRVFCEEDIGDAYRVDFSPCGKRPGFKTIQTTQTSLAYYKSAFVHFNELSYGAYLKLDFQRMEQGEYQLLQSKPSWRILKNYNAIPSTMMNTHQIVANAALLEERVDKQEIKLKQQ